MATQTGTGKGTRATTNLVSERLESALREGFALRLEKVKPDCFALSDRQGGRELHRPSEDEKSGEGLHGGGFGEAGKDLPRRRIQVS